MRVHDDQHGVGTPPLRLFTQSAVPTDRCARKIVRFLTVLVVRSRRLKGKPFGARPSSMPRHLHSLSVRGNLSSKSHNAGGRIVSLSFQLGRADLAAAAKYVAEHNPSIKGELFRAQLFCGILAGGVAVAIIFMTAHTLRFSELLFPALSALVAYLLGGYLLKRSYIDGVVAIVSDRKPTFSRTMTLVLQEDGLAGSSEVGSSTILWSAIQHMDEDAQYIYLSLPSASTILIPNHAFTSGDQRETFLTTIRSRVNK